MVARLRELLESGGPILVPVALASLLAWAVAIDAALRCRELARRVRGARADEGANDDGLVAAIEPRLRLLAALVSSLPLLGLLGTVAGMIATFANVQRGAIGDPRLLAGGIREALLATASGLAAALPLLLVHQMLAAWLHRNESRPRRVDESRRRSGAHERPRRAAP